MMDDASLERGLRARPPADPTYRSRISGSPTTAIRAPLTRAHLARPGRARPMLTATRLVAVIAIASLGAGVLLFASGGGPSPTPSASPSPTPWTPPAGWVTEPVEPGVVRVLSDGIRQISPAGVRDRHRMSIGADGSIWLSVRSGAGVLSEPTGTLARLGDPVSYPVDGLASAFDYGPVDLQIGPDGSPWARTKAGLMHLEQDGWVVLDGSTGRAYDIAPDGTIWQADSTSWISVPDGPVDLAWRWAGSDWESPPFDVDLAAALGVDPDVITGHEVKGFRAAPDGSVWAGLSVAYRDDLSPNEDGFGHLLLRFDGETWSVIDPMGIGSYFDMEYFAVGADGTAWVYLDTGDDTDPHLARLSDGEWTVYSREDGVTPIGIRGEMPGYLEVAPDGTAWMHQLMDGPGRCRGVRSFDGKTWRRYLDGTCVVDLDIAPDGSVWVTGARDPGFGQIWPYTGDTYRIEPAS